MWCSWALDMDSFSTELAEETSLQELLFPQVPAELLPTKPPQPE